MPNLATTKLFRTRESFEVGERYFNAQDLKPGVIVSRQRGWFTFRHDDGTSTVLDSSRICTLSFAQTHYPSFL